MTLPVSQTTGINRRPRPATRSFFALPELTLFQWALLGGGSFLVIFAAGGLQLFLPRNMFGPLLTPLGLLAAFEIYRLRMKLWNVIARDWPLFALMAIAAISVTWAIDPKLSLLRVVVLLSLLSVAIYGTVIIQRRSFLNMLDLAFSIAIGLSFLLSALVPSIGQSPQILHHGDSWSGLFAHRSYLSAIAAMGIFLWAYKWLDQPSTWRFQAIRIALAFVTLYMANSKTSLLSCAAALMIFAIIRFLQCGKIDGKLISRSMAQAILLSVFILVPTSMSVVAPMIPQLVGREDNLSGRTRMWRWGFYVAQERSVLGAGYRSFWGSSEVGDLVLKDRPWNYAKLASRGSKLGNGHNGYYDTYFELGYAGIIALVIFLLSAGSRVIRLLRGPPDPLVPFSAAVFTYVMVDNVAETVFLNPSSIGWPMLVLSYLLLGKALQSQRENLQTGRPAQ